MAGQIHEGVTEAGPALEVHGVVREVVEAAEALAIQHLKQHIARVVVGQVPEHDRRAPPGGLSSCCCAGSARRGVGPPRWRRGRQLLLLLLLLLVAAAGLALEAARGRAGVAGGRLQHSSTLLEAPCLFLRADPAAAPGAWRVHCSGGQTVRKSWRRQSHSRSGRGGSLHDSERVGAEAPLARGQAQRRGQGLSEVLDIHGPRSCHCRRTRTSTAGAPAWGGRAAVAGGRGRACGRRLGAQLAADGGSGEFAAAAAAAAAVVDVGVRLRARQGRRVLGARLLRHRLMDEGSAHLVHPAGAQRVGEAYRQLGVPNCNTSCLEPNLHP
mmetsp:Transcript_63253/g.205265  ORF Transcript_63253/g.205265 Transcript_63253/m.205265 type:complete len:326 (-) Transcript_63253:9-986(-)